MNGGWRNKLLTEEYTYVPNTNKLENCDIIEYCPTERWYE